jgi:acyl-coenzyme A thioesterase PaaI-like protein
MGEIRNPFIERPDYNCFGCSPLNEGGLRMSFREEGEEILSSWLPEKRFAGYGGILHGGIQATLHDEIASWLVLVKLSTAGFTERLEIDYRNPVRIDEGEIALSARLERMEGNRAFIRTTLLDAKGRLGSESLGVFFTLPKHIAMKKMGYPGDGAFLSP